MKKKLLFCLLCVILLFSVTGCGSSEKNHEPSKPPHQIAIESLEEGLKNENFTLCDEEEYCDGEKSYILKKENEDNGIEIDVFDFDKLEWKIYNTKNSDDGTDKVENIYEYVYKLTENKAEGKLKKTEFMRKDGYVNGGITRTVKYQFSMDYEKNDKECRVASYECDNPAFAMLDESSVRKRNCNIYALELSNIKYDFNSFVRKLNVNVTHLIDKNAE